MTDIPIIFSAPMVRALLDGRKTMTRRLAMRETKNGIYLPSPWQKVQSGDRLWVREAVAAGACAPKKPSEWSPSFWAREQGCIHNPTGLWYDADDTIPSRLITSRGKWIPSIHMPRWASRLTLIVRSVRVERLHDINLTDIEREGIVPRGQNLSVEEAVAKWIDLWTTLHGAGSWDQNPEVVALTLTVHKTNIDKLEKPQ